MTAPADPHRALASDGRVDAALPETYADGWKRQPDDALAFALFVATGGGADAGATVETWSANEWQRDDYRMAARVAREQLGAPVGEPTRAELLATIERQRAALREIECHDASDPDCGVGCVEECVRTATRALHQETPRAAR